MTEGRLSLGSLGGYRLVERLGRDTTGTVYRARDAAGVEVAVKVIAPALAADAEFMDRLRSSAEPGGSSAEPGGSPGKEPEGGTAPRENTGIEVVLAADLDGPRPYLVARLDDVAMDSLTSAPSAASPSAGARREQSLAGPEQGKKPGTKRWSPVARLAVGGAAVGLAIAAVAGVRIWLDDGAPEPVEIVYREAGQKVVEANPATPVRRLPAPVKGPMPQATMMEVAVASPSGEAGVFCHGAGRDGYELTLSGDGRAAIIKYAGGSRTVLGTARVRAGRDVSMVGACVRERSTPLVRLSLWLDGERVADAADGRDSLRSGSAGLVVRRPGSRHAARAVFENLRVSRF